MLAFVNQFLSWTQKKEPQQTVTMKVRVPFRQPVRSSVSHSFLFIVLNKREIVLTTAVAVSPT